MSHIEGESKPAIKVCQTMHIVWDQKFIPRRRKLWMKHLKLSFAYWQGLNKNSNERDMSLREREKERDRINLSEKVKKGHKNQIQQ